MIVDSPSKLTACHESFADVVPTALTINPIGVGNVGGMILGGTTTTGEVFVVLFSTTGVLSTTTTGDSSA